MATIHIFLMLLSIQLMRTQTVNPTTAALNVSVNSNLTKAEPGVMTAAATTSTIIEIRNYAISLVNNSFTSQNSCKTVVVKLIHAQSSVEGSCKLLCMAKGGLLSNQHCNEHDYNLLNNALCSNFTCTTQHPQVGAMTTPATDSTTISAELIEIRNYAISLVNNSFTSKDYCKKIVVQLIQAQSSVEGSCKLLCLAKGGLWSSQQCNELDYNLLNNALCSDYSCNTSAPDVKSTRSPEDLEKHRENVKCVIDNELSSEVCRNEVNRQSEGDDDPERACRVLQSFLSAFRIFRCTAEEYDKLFRVICEKQLVPCSPVTSLLRNLTSMCRGVMNASLNQLLAPGACNFVESQKQHLTANAVCTAGDYEKMHQIVCSKNSSLSQAIGEGQRVEKAEETITTKLTETCRGVIGPEFQMHGLKQLCQNVRNSGASLVSQGVCTLEDIDLLRNVLCFGNIEYTSNEQSKWPDLQSVIETLSSRCKVSMQALGAQSQGMPLKASCKLLTANRETILVTNTCNEEEITRVTNLLCSRANTPRFNWITALCVYLVFSKIFASSLIAWA